MRQLVLPSSYKGGSSIVISGPDSKYIQRVLRLGTGDSFPAVDHDGKPFILTISDVKRDSFTAECVERTVKTDDSENNEKSGPKLVLLQCIPKGKKLELIVRQAVEAGVSFIVPVESDYSVAEVHEDRSKKKTDRMIKIAEEAAQQSGNPGVPKIGQPVKLSELPGLLQKTGTDGLRLFFHQERLEKVSLHGYLKSAPDTVLILIGPEGGLSPDETDFLLASNFHPVYLGKNVLRTETAAIYALGAVKTILMEKNEWKTDIRE